MYLISLDMEDQKKLWYRSVDTHTNTHIQGDCNDSTYGGEIKFNLLNCIYAC